MHPATKKIDKKIMVLIRVIYYINNKYEPARTLLCGKLKK